MIFKFHNSEFIIRRSCALAAVAFTVVMTAACHRATPAASEQPPIVTVATIETSGGDYDIKYPGLVKAAHELDLSFKVAGTIDCVFVKEGDRVCKGQLLARLDTVDYRNQLDATTAEYEAVMAEAGRVVDLYNDDATTRSNYDKAVSGMRQIQSKLNYHRNQLDYCYLRAPMDGMVSACHYSAHENVSAGMQIVQMLGSGSHEVEIHVSDKIYVNRDRIVGYSCRLGPYGDQEFILTPISYAPSANANQLYTVRLKVENPKGLQILPGMNASVTAKVNSGQHTISVPTRSLSHDSDGEHIWIVRADSTVACMPVRVLDVSKNGTCRIEADSLDDGCRVVTSGLSRIKEGMKVRPIAGASETNIGGLL